MKIENFAVKATSLKKRIPKYDYHLHTTFTDGKATVEQTVLKAIEIGLERIIFTEHTEPWLIKDADWFIRYYDEIRMIKDKIENKIDIYIGVEAPAIDLKGGLLLDNVIVNKCDYILGAAHRYPGLKEGERVKDLTHERAIKLEYETLMALAENKSIHAIAHVGATCSKYVSTFPDSMVKEIIKKATSNNIAIEINDQYHQPLDKFIQICIEEDAWVVLGSNAHSLEQIGSSYRSLERILN